MFNLVHAEQHWQPLLQHRLLTTTSRPAQAGRHIQGTGRVMAAGELAWRQGQGVKAGQQAGSWVQEVSLVRWC